MIDKRRRYSADFKSKIALEAIREKQTLQELAQKHGLHPSQINKWKKEAMENLSSLFEPSSSSSKSSESDTVARLEQKVGQLVIENDFLRKNWEGWTLRKGGK